MKSTKNYQNPIDTYIEQQPIEIQAKLHQLRVHHQTRVTASYREDFLRDSLPTGITRTSFILRVIRHTLLCILDHRLSRSLPNNLNPIEQVRAPSSLI